jgi:hypothetical protein
VGRYSAQIESFRTMARNHREHKRNCEASGDMIGAAESEKVAALADDAADRLEQEPDE